MQDSQEESLQSYLEDVLLKKRNELYRSVSNDFKLFDAKDLKPDAEYRGGFINSAGDFCFPTDMVTVTLLGRKNGVTHLVMHSEDIPSLNMEFFEVDQRKSESIKFVEIAG